MSAFMRTDGEECAGMSEPVHVCKVNDCWYHNADIDEIEQHFHITHSQIHQRFDHDCVTIMPRDQAIKKQVEYKQLINSLGILDLITTSKTDSTLSTPADASQLGYPASQEIANIMGDYPIIKEEKEEDDEDMPNSIFTTPADQKAAKEKARKRKIAEKAKEVRTTETRLINELAHCLPPEFVGEALRDPKGGVNKVAAALGAMDYIHNLEQQVVTWKNCTEVENYRRIEGELERYKDGYDRAIQLFATGQITMESLNTAAGMMLPIAEGETHRKESGKMVELSAVDDEGEGEAEEDEIEISCETEMKIVDVVDTDMS